MRPNLKTENWELKTRKTYDKIAGSFRQTREKKDPVLDLFFSKMRPQGRVLEIGCGSARSLEHLERQGFFKKKKNFYIGIDYSHKLLEVASEQPIAKKNRSKIRFRHVDIKRLKLKDRFDWVLSLAVLHHFSPQTLPLVLKKIFNALKEKGRLVGYIWSPPTKTKAKWLKIGRSEYLKFWQNNKELPLYYHFLFPTELKRLLKETGFHCVSVQAKGRGVKRNIFFEAQK